MSREKKATKTTKPTTTVAKKPKKTKKTKAKVKGANVGHGLTLLRKFYGMTLEEFSSNTGIKVKVASSLEKDLRTPTDKEINQIAKGYKLEHHNLRNFLSKSKDKPRKLVEAIANYDFTVGELEQLKNKLETTDSRKSTEIPLKINPLVLLQTPIKEIPGYLKKVLRG